MTIRKSAYDTTVAKHYVIKPIIDKLQIKRVNYEYASLDKSDIEKGGAFKLGDDLRLNAITMVTGESSDSGVPSFSHPISLYTNTGELARISIDVRPFIKKTNSYGEWDVRVPYEYNFMILRGVLQYIWETDANRHLQSLSKLPIKIYSRWIADNIARRMGLDPETQLTISIIAAYYYLTLFVDDEFNTVQKNRNIAIIANAVSSSAQMVERVISQIPEGINSLEDLTTTIREVTGSARLEGFDVTILLTATTSGWFGPQGRELCGVALEHPPTWIAMLLAAASLKGYTQTGIARLFYKTESKDIDQLVTAIFGLFKE